MTPAASLWDGLKAQPVLWLSLTLGAYALGTGLQRRAGGSPLINPVLASCAIIIPILSVSHTPYAVYAENAGLLHVLLGPVTVALAVPLYGHRGRLRHLALPIAGALVVGSLVAMISAAGLAALFHLDRQTVLSLIPKSATTPIAMGVSTAIGGVPPLTAALVILTGVLGSTIGEFLFTRCRISDPDAQGFALGLACSGIGAAHGFQVDRRVGALAGIAIGLNGLATALLAPLLVKGLFG